MNSERNRALRILALCTLALAASGGLARAEDGAAMAARFGALEDVQQISLSPSGNAVAYLKPNAEAGVTVIVADLGTGQSRAVLNAANAGESLRWCRWASETRLLCLLDITVNRGDVRLGATRYVTVRSDGTGQAYLSTGLRQASLGGVQYAGTVLDWDIAGKPGHVLMTREFVPEARIGSNIERRREGLGVEDVDLESGKRVVVEQPRADASAYITDGQGHVRMMARREHAPDGYAKDTLEWLYRTKDDDKWLPLRQGQGRGWGDTPLAIDPERNICLCPRAQGRLRCAVRRRARWQRHAAGGAGTGRGRCRRAHRDRAQWPGCGRGPMPRTAGPTCSSIPNCRSWGWLWAEALPGQPLIRFIDSSQDESRLLMLASSDANPGMFYRYDKAAHRLEQVLPVREPLEKLALGTMTAVTYPAGDGNDGARLSHLATRQRRP